jgi:hypothetical protein
VDEGCDKGTLGALDVEVMHAQDVEDNTDVLEVLSPGGVVDQNVVEEDEHTSTQEWMQDKVH